MCQSHGKPLHLQLPSPVSCHPPLRCIFLPWHKTHLAQIYPSVFASSSTCSKREYTQQERCTTILFCSQHQRVDLKFLWTAQAYSHNGTYLCYQPPNCHNQYCEIHVVGRSPIVQPGELTRSRYHFCDFVTPVTRGHELVLFKWHKIYHSQCSIGFVAHKLLVLWIFVL